MEAAKRAATASEVRQNAYLNLARFYAARNDFKGTEESLRAAITIAPNWYQPHWMLARILREVGRIEEARGEAALAAELNGGRVDWPVTTQRVDIISPSVLRIVLRR